VRDLRFSRREYLVPASFNTLFAVRTLQPQKRTMSMRDKSTMPDNVLEYGMSTCLKKFDAMSAREKHRMVGRSRIEGYTTLTIQTSDISSTNPPRSTSPSSPILFQPNSTTFLVFHHEFCCCRGYQRRKRRETFAVT